MQQSTNTRTLLNLMKRGVTGSAAAQALGITPSAVTQLMDTPEVKTEVAKLQEEQLKKSSLIDEKWDNIETRLLDQLEKVIPTLLRPNEIARVLQIANGAKRRGVAAATETGPAAILNLTLPVAVKAKFVLDAKNQVVQAGAQTLVTIQSNNVKALASEKANVPILQPPSNSSAEDQWGFTYPD